MSRNSTCFTPHDSAHDCHCRCFIAPPNLLARIAAEGNPRQRRAAVRSLAASASMRSRRSTIGALMHEPNIDIRTLSFFTAKTASEAITVYDAKHGGQSSLPGKKVRDQNDPLSKDAAVNEAYDGAEETRKFYKEILGRNSIDDEGLEIVSSVHFGVDYENAFWNGTQMVYGDGGGEIFAKGTLTKAIDVIGHELTHGVTQFSAALEYSKQPGALNESFSDVFGSIVKQFVLRQTVEQADWLIGEGTLKPDLGVALRSMKEPGTANKFDDQPGHMRDYQDLPDDNDPRNDNGGVHINSGILNKAFYLAAMELGGSSWEVAGKIWYETLTKRLHPTSDFAAAAQATIATAGELYEHNSTEQRAIRNAWDEVGVSVGAKAPAGGG